MTDHPTDNTEIKIYIWTRDTEIGRRIAAAIEELELDFSSWVGQMQRLVIEDQEKLALQTVDGLREVIGYQISFVNDDEEEPHAKH